MRKDPYLQEVGQRIKAIRKERKITIRKLGELCQLDYSCLSRIEGGQYSSGILTLKNIAEKLGVDIIDLLR
ncbi:MAG: Helix-turn-helix domain [Mucilaginibacter sp.]|nr:Helix-turn-helix domain [Mucilaginibacter sp.]